MANHNELGKRGEETVIKMLRQKGYTIIAQNWFYEKYEIDIIARNEEWFVFVEVKTRTSDQWGNPEEAISKGKIKRIVEAADFYLRDNEIELPARFDVAAVTINGKELDIEYIEDAFMAPLM